MKVSKWEKKLIDEDLTAFFMMNPTDRAIAIIRLSNYEKAELSGIICRIVTEGKTIERKRQKQKEQAAEWELERKQRRRKRNEGSEADDQNSNAEEAETDG